jgi:uncharacterized protein YndB with AHSA1/START domain
MPCVVATPTPRAPGCGNRLIWHFFSSTAHDTRHTTHDTRHTGQLPAENTIEGGGGRGDGGEGVCTRLYRPLVRLAR